MGLGGEPERCRATAVRGVEPLRIETDLQDPGLAPPPRCWCGRKPEMSGPLCLALLRMAQSLGLSLGCATRLRRLLDGCGSQAPTRPFAARRWGRRQKYLECFNRRHVVLLVGGMLPWTGV